MTAIFNTFAIISIGVGLLFYIISNGVNIIKQKNSKNEKNSKVNIWLLSGIAVLFSLVLLINLPLFLSLLLFASIYIVVYLYKKKFFETRVKGILGVGIFLVVCCSWLVLYLASFYMIEAYTQKEISKKSLGDCRIVNTRIAYETNLPMYVYYLGEDKKKSVYHVFVMGKDGKIIDRSNLGSNQANDNGETLKEFTILCSKLTNIKSRK